MASQHGLPDGGVDGIQRNATGSERFCPASIEYSGFLPRTRSLRTGSHKTDADTLHSSLRQTSRKKSFEQQKYGQIGIMISMDSIVPRKSDCTDIRYQTDRRTLRKQPPETLNAIIASKHPTHQETNAQVFVSAIICKNHNGHARQSNHEDDGIAYRPPELAETDRKVTSRKSLIRYVESPPFRSDAGEILKQHNTFNAES
ncbi:hypothetical protein F8A10_01560 [Paracoccus kondratievae]|uniref:hypothetical protein n=1 Tax=Paracoccus TaxID=265 RepID=UPI000A0EA793|nr:MULTISPECIES: hypothetical protein [Paracoccus]QFQ86220.1 hypothetical protein F8A10_01560 [Paracoccus kondratievae]SMG14202.1 hypothetical protein SAMN02746000_00713 [Paracoccus sp. J56]